MATPSKDRILALDYGRKHIGLAISDEAGLGSTPLTIFVRSNRADDLRRLREIARKFGVGRLVVGFPLHLDGAESEMSAEAKSFAKRLRKHLGIPVDLFDERLSSWAAGTEVPSRARRDKAAAHRRDDLAAAIILRDYLADRSSSCAATGKR